jgi:hypothetical protein
MRMMTKLLTTTLLGSATFWACGVERAPDRTSQVSNQLEDGPGSGTDPGSGSDPTDPPTCTAEGDPNQADLDAAKAKLKKYLKGCTGQAAIDKVLGEFDTNPKDGKLSRAELLGLVTKIQLGWPVYDYACGKVMKAIDTDGDGSLTQDELKKFLDKIGLGGPDQCVVPTEDTPDVPTEPTGPTEDSPGAPGAP